MVGQSGAGPRAGVGERGPLGDGLLGGGEAPVGVSEAIEAVLGDVCSVEIGRNGGVKEGLELGLGDGDVVERDGDGGEYEIVGGVGIGG